MYRTNLMTGMITGQSEMKLKQQQKVNSMLRTKVGTTRDFILLVSFITVVLSLIHAVSAQSKSVKRNDGAYQLNIKLSGSLQNPAFAPDGQSIVFTRFRKGYNKGPSDICIYDLATRKHKVIVTDKHSNVNLPGSVWSKSRNEIVFSSDQDPHDEIYSISMKGAGTRKIKITNRSKKQSYEPSFSPDGKWIVFESHDIDVADLGVITKYKLDGSSDYITLTSAAESCTQPNWSPAGEQILYQKKTKGVWAIWTMSSSGKNHKRVTPASHSSTDAVFSSDGKSIIYSSENKDVEHANIYSITSDKGIPHRVTRYQGYDGAPAISSNGTKIAFESVNGEPDNSKGTTLWMIDIKHK